MDGGGPGWIFFWYLATVFGEYELTQRSELHFYKGVSQDHCSIILDDNDTAIASDNDTAIAIANDIASDNDTAIFSDNDTAIAIASDTASDNDTAIVSDNDTAIASDIASDNDTAIVSDNDTAIALASDIASDSDTAIASDSDACSLCFWAYFTNDCDSLWIPNTVFLKTTWYHATLWRTPGSVIPVIMPGFLQWMTFTVNLLHSSNIDLHSQNHSLVLR
ncbi:hypothetical protein ROHU_020475 [Labeo rohita]|uniref:Uncharacterized protein n=1 Tax=Labeo rohita TaxID=84645 RepID=A0A498N5E3_LABRO|nr:hypothetical protein ROHU_020475 [Labeo rohita]